jgi:hypothetical protein
MRQERMTTNGTQAGSGLSRQEMAAKVDMQPSAARAPITRARLELAIAEAVRSTLPECRALIGVIVERVVPGSPGGVNWMVKGVKFGKAQRDRCRAAIAVCVEDGQREYEVSD